MARWYAIDNVTTARPVLTRARVCASFWSHFRGLQFTRRLLPGHGLWFVTGSEGRSHTAIHMFFVFYSIGVIWVDANGRVVDKALARPWRPYYAPRVPARDFIEGLPDILDAVAIGDQLAFIEQTA